jgi:GNAT superfamily N-acetyltransferase
MTVRIRVATGADIQDMHRVRMSVRENRLTSPARVQPYHYEALLNEGARAWVAEVDDRIVGFAVGDLARSNVWALFVEPTFERQGVGRRLHDGMMAWLFDAGAQVVWLKSLGLASRRA